MAEVQVELGNRDSIKCLHDKGFAWAGQVKKNIPRVLNPHV